MTLLVESVICYETGSNRMKNDQFLWNSSEIARNTSKKGYILCAMTLLVESVIWYKTGSNLMKND